jgi:hypothetical protein
MKQAPLAAAVAIAALAGGAGMASAQAFSLGEVYVKGFGGATWPSNFDTTLKEGGEQIARPSFDYDTGYTLGRRGRRGLHAEHLDGDRVRLPQRRRHHHRP